MEQFLDDDFSADFHISQRTYDKGDYSGNSVKKMWKNSFDKITPKKCDVPYADVVSYDICSCNKSPHKIGTSTNVAFLDKTLNISIRLEEVVIVFFIILCIVVLVSIYKIAISTINNMFSKKNQVEVASTVDNTDNLGIAQ